MAITQTALDLITSSLRLINVAAAGESVPLDTANDSLMVFNQMLDAWNAERLAVYTTRADDYPLTNKQSFTYGPGGDFNTDRPANIDAMSVIILTNPANPVELPIELYSVQDWQNKIPVKSTTSAFPLVCYDSGDFPLRTLNFWPIPTDANNVRIYSWQALGAPADISSSVSFPPGYAEAFRYNLAVRLGAEFSAPVPPLVQEIAVSSFARVKSMNTPDLSITSDFVSPHGTNYRQALFGLPY
jgi:hypothetical protein